MKYIKDLKEGAAINDIYLVRTMQRMVTKNGKPYISLTLQDKTGTIDGKIWEVDSPGIEEFDALDYVFIGGDVTTFNSGLQANIKRARKAAEGDFDPAEYLPVSDHDIDKMYDELLDIIDTIKAPYMKQLLNAFFRDDEKFREEFCFQSAAKSVHHGFVGGLLEHTLSVTRVCDFFSKNYPYLDRDLLLTAAICHDIGKLKELTPFPENDYTDAGQLLGHIVIGNEMVRNKIRNIPDFPAAKATELMHCILAHHGELEFGSPKKPALIEAVALSFADNVDAKLETFREAVANTAPGDTSWQGFNRFLESNIRRTSVPKE